MSSSNLVQIAVIPEVAYGVTPAAGNFKRARFISESLSGSAETTESQQIRTDRMSSGQVVTGLTVGGEVGFELAKENLLEDFISSAMLNNWVVSAPVVVDLSYDHVAKTLTRDSGDFNADVAVGDVLTLSGFVETENNTQVMVNKIVSATVISIGSPSNMVTEVGTGTSLKVADKITIGTTKKSFSMEKKFLDLTDKAIGYRGMLVDEMNLSVNYGEIVNGSFTFSGNDYQPTDSAATAMTNGRTIDPAATTNSMNGSVDMPFISTSSVGELTESNFCIQGVTLNLKNNYSAQTCIGKVAPKDYSAGMANVEFEMNAYLADNNWAILGKKLSQAPFAIGFGIKNEEGFYGFYLPAVQVSFDDPSSQGANQDISLSMKGVAKVGSLGESALVIYRA